MEYRFRFAPQAVADAEEAYGWIAQQSPVRAARWYTKLFEAIETLKTNPSRCSLAPESDAFDEEIRQLLYGKRRGTYRILFTVRGHVVHVFRILHGSRQSLKPEDVRE